MENESLQHLGKISNIPQEPSPEILEAIENPHTGQNYVVRFTCPEFTSLCPVTGQPDFAHLVLDFVPDKYIVESKSLKLYMVSYRNQSGFHEKCTVQIAKDIIHKIKPKFIRLAGYWFPRGGIPIDVFFQDGALPKGTWLPDQGVAPYRGRG
jgi:7-cyano-7-deazaguanine reductase